MDQIIEALEHNICPTDNEIDFIKSKVVNFDAEIVDIILEVYIYFDKDGNKSMDFSGSDTITKFIEIEGSIPKKLIEYITNKNVQANVRKLYQNKILNSKEDLLKAYTCISINEFDDNLLNNLPKTDDGRFELILGYMMQDYDYLGLYSTTNNDFLNDETTFMYENFKFYIIENY